MTPTGLTQDAGWEMGVRKTVPAPLPQVWDFLIGEGLPLWLGETTLGARRRDQYETADGTRGEIRRFHPHERIRLTWEPQAWDHESILQITLMQVQAGTTIGFHQEQLASAAEREEMLDHWHDVADRIAAALGKRTAR
ncbi:SRPBCC domain-containing protein [Crystallibacter degradans]|uniref:SRPBCC domain-containing protein n=1 Tax=Crystallibacter degradans TaxID=2726743 RepID=UPI00147566B7|nr:SRPBCC domain-containing protein [Arthrobacter sp. SF27]NMR29262.1 SRPBCC domain-containing protein [Arthrobacter sp. SF27]